jgi:hypothetical protein
MAVHRAILPVSFAGLMMREEKQPAAPTRQGAIVRPPQLRDEGVATERFRLMPVGLIKLCIEAQN